LGIFAVLIFGICGCAHFRGEAHYREPQDINGQLLEYYSYPSRTIKARSEVLEEREAYVIKKVEFPSAVNIMGKNDIIRFDYYQQKAQGTFPAIIVFPILGGENMFARLFSDYFCRNGFNCVIIYRQEKFYSVEQLESLEWVLRQAVINARQVVDWLVTQPEVDREKLGSFGISFGGIKGALLAAAEKRLRCHIIALAGGNLPEIICYAHEPRIARYRKAYMHKENVGLTELRRRLASHLESDPLRLAKYIDSEKVLFISALFDRVIGRHYSKQLWEAMGKPEVIYVPFGHYSSLFAIPHLKRASVEFFRRKFAQE
jgi:hypothetical protein